MPKAAFSIREFCASHSISKSTVYKEIGAGRLRAVKIGDRTLIPEQSAADWLNALERMPPAADRAA